MIMLRNARNGHILKGTEQEKNYEKQFREVIKLAKIITSNKN